MSTFFLYSRVTFLLDSKDIFKANTSFIFSNFREDPVRGKGVFLKIFNNAQILLLNTGRSF